MDSRRLWDLGSLLGVPPAQNSQRMDLRYLHSSGFGMRSLRSVAGSQWDRRDQWSI